jgi:phage tail-like protein
VTFATVVLRRGISTNRDLYDWFHTVGSGAYEHRRSVEIVVMSPDGSPVMTWQLENALPVKLKVADLNAKATDVGIEELHLAHEGLRLGD